MYAMTLAMKVVVHLLYKHTLCSKVCLWCCVALQSGEEEYTACTDMPLFTVCLYTTQLPHSHNEQHLYSPYPHYNYVAIGSTTHEKGGSHSHSWH